MEKYHSSLLFSECSAWKDWNASMNHVVLSLLNIMIRMKYLRDSVSNIIAILPKALVLYKCIEIASLCPRPEPFKYTVPEDLKDQIDRNPHPKSHPSPGQQTFKSSLWRCERPERTLAMHELQSLQGKSFQYNLPLLFWHYKHNYCCLRLLHPSVSDATNLVQSRNQSHLRIESGLVLVAGVREGVRGVTKWGGLRISHSD